MTDSVVHDQGAFGCPWFWVVNTERRAHGGHGRGGLEGESEKVGGEPFFGSDRWHFIWDYLGVEVPLPVPAPGVLGLRDMDYRGGGDNQYRLGVGEKGEGEKAKL